jgi:hypothetical protein
MTDYLAALHAAQAQPRRSLGTWPLPSGQHVVAYLNPQRGLGGSGIECAWDVPPSTAVPWDADRAHYETVVHQEIEAACSAMILET